MSSTSIAKKICLALMLALAGFMQAGCNDRCTDPTSAFSCKDLEEKDHAVFLTFADKNNGKLLGVTKGVAACRSMAYKHANSINLTKESGWSYVCCTKTADSECAEKHW
jgi:hypothetical protein